LNGSQKQALGYADGLLLYFFHIKGELKKLALQNLRLREKAGEKRGKIPEIALIDSRPAGVNTRKVPFHWKGGLIIGKDRKPAILVTVERTSRFVQMDLLERIDGTKED
jgi:IS30 family transposase